MPDEFNADDIPPLLPPERCHQFRYELNKFICSRSEEWDLNRYELMGVMLSEMFRQLAADDDDDEEVDGDAADDDDEDDD
jgi:hypothetical protein